MTTNNDLIQPQSMKDWHDWMWYSESYVKTMMERQYEKGKQDGKVIEHHLAYPIDYDPNSPFLNVEVK